LLQAGNASVASNTRAKSLVTFIVVKIIGWYL
jgi:hypothetical protein